MQENERYVFGYGSILSPASMAKDIGPKCFEKWTTLTGYGRVFDWPVDGALALNLMPKDGSVVDGMLLKVNDEQFAALEKREKGYSAVDVTAGMPEAYGLPVYAFIAPNGKHPDMHINKSYYDLCLSGVPKSMQKEWLENTLIENEVK